MDLAFETTRRILCEDGAGARLGALAKPVGMTRALVVTDDGLVRAGVLDVALDSFRHAGVAVQLFTGVRQDPPEDSIQEAVRMAREVGADGIVGFGGGSSMDTAKLVALLAATDQDLAAIYGIGLARGPRLPLIQVPTTAGTGSEVTPIAIVTTPTDEKKGVVSNLLYPDLAVLDPQFTLGLPPQVTAMTGIDAMVHAIEAFTSRHRKNPVSDALAVRALQLLAGHIRRVLADGRDVKARSAMLQGSMLAGMAFANAPVAAVHALAYPIGGHFHVPHGLSNALVLVPVLRFNLPAAESAYAELAPVLRPGGTFRTRAEAAGGFIDAVTELVSEMPFAQRLSEVGVREADLPMMAEDAMKQQRLLVNNPRDVGYDDAFAIYRSVL